MDFPEVENAWMVTHNWRLAERVVVKLYPDTVLFYGYLEIVLLVAALASEFKPVGLMLSKKCRGVSAGHVLLAIWSTAFLVLFTFYWAHDHAYHSGKYNF